MDPASLVEVFNALAKLQNDAEAVFQHLFVLHVDQKTQTDTFHKLHDKKLLIVNGCTVFKRVDDVFVLELNGDLTFRRFVESEKP